MSLWVDELNEVSQLWFGMMCNVVVQSVLVFAVALIAARLLRGVSASLRFWIWQAAALKLLLVPFAAIVVLPLLAAPRVHEAASVESTPVSTEQFEAIETPVTYTPPPQMQIHSPKQDLPRLSALTCLFAGWLLVCWIQMLRCLRRRRRLATFLQTCSPVSDSQRLRLLQLAQKVGVSRRVNLMQGDVQVPLVTGLVRPTIVLPSQQELDRSKFDQVVLHELAHVKRRDLFWVWLPEATRMLLFFHPIAYWIQRYAKLESEMACDELVLATGSSRREYAQTLLELAAPSAVT